MSKKANFPTNIHVRGAVNKYLPQYEGMYSDPIFQHYCDPNQLTLHNFSEIGQTVKKI